MTRFVGVRCWSTVPLNVCFKRGLSKLPGKGRCHANVQESPVSISSKEVVLRYYEGWNARNVDLAMTSIADDCEYEDLVFQDPFIGADDFREYLEETISNVDDDIRFVIDDITDGDDQRVGVLWHCEVNGVEFPFSRGVSFYRVENGRIKFGRDIVEPTFKPGHGAIKVLSLITPIVKKLGKNANPSILKKLPIAAGAMWLFYAAYLGYVILGTSAPGNAAWQITPENLQSVLNDSMNIFFLVPFLNWVGVPFAPELVENPVDEAVFNLVAAWGLMFLPLILTDPEGYKMKDTTKWSLWTGLWFLTNIFFIPYLALRLQPSETPPTPPPELPSWSPLVGATGFFVGNLCLIWGALGRPEFGDLGARITHAVEAYGSDRVFFAFCVDTVLYSIFQTVMMPKAPAKFRYVPFFGMAAYLLTSSPKQTEAEA
ncbi:hypothetical protein BSKO_08481 [Bryopsis sp. KO-2023]|nr:hypothetical protein BSKO_08481 [Bryopsis sp. KO-2023]